MALMPLQTPTIPIIEETPTTTPDVAPEAVLPVLSDVIDIYCSCVLYVRTQIPELPKGDAKDFIPNIDIPIEGGVVIFNYGHIAYIEAVTGTRIKISEANKSRCKYGERYLNINDPSIIGFWYSTLSG